MLYCFGNPAEALKFTYGLPFIEIFYNATSSKAGTTANISLLISMYIFATSGFLAAASRQAWAFSRDGGLPLSGIFRRVSITILSDGIHEKILISCARSTLAGPFLSGQSLSLEPSTLFLGSSILGHRKQFRL